MIQRVIRFANVLIRDRTRAMSEAITPAVVNNHSRPTKGEHLVLFVCDAAHIAYHCGCWPAASFSFHELHLWALLAAEYLCKLSANTFKLQFLELKIMDAKSGALFYEVCFIPRLDAY